MPSAGDIGRMQALETALQENAQLKLALSRSRAYESVAERRAVELREERINELTV